MGVPARLQSIFAALLLLCSMSQGQSASVPPPATPAAPIVPKPIKITIVPNTVYVGEQYAALLTVDPADCPTGASPLASLVSIGSSSNTDVLPDKIATVTNNPCQVSVPLKVGPTAIAGNIPLYLYPKDSTSVIGSVSLAISGSRSPAPAPIPPGMAPNADLMFKVLPRKSVADSYGNRVADHYFAIEATIGNNSGYDIQLAALGFVLNPTPTGKDHSGNTLSTDSSPNPNDSYPIVRGTIEREQSVGTRAIVVNIIRAAGPVLTGVAGFYDGGLSTTFLESSSLFSGAFEKGIELV